MPRPDVEFKSKLSSGRDPHQKAEFLPKGWEHLRGEQGEHNFLDSALTLTKRGKNDQIDLSEECRVFAVGSRVVVASFPHRGG